MMEEQPSTPPPQKSASKNVGRVVLWGFSLLVIWLFLMMTIGPGLFEPGFILATGWIQFLARTTPKITWNWDLICMGVFCFVLIVFIAQRSLDWLARAIASARGIAWRWPWRWTLCGLVVVGLCFLVGMCVGGMVHQIGWLSSQTESWYERKGEIFLDMRRLDHALQQALLEADGDFEKVRRELKNPESGSVLRQSGEAFLIERFHVLLIIEGKNKIIGSIIFPRDHSRRANSRGMYRFENRDDTFQMQNLPELIKKHQEQLLAI